MREQKEAIGSKIENALLLNFVLLPSLPQTTAENIAKIWRSIGYPVYPVYPAYPVYHISGGGPLEERH